VDLSDDSDDLAAIVVRLIGLGLGKVAGYLASAALIFLGAIFLLASVYATSRLLVGAILIVAGLGVALLTLKAGVGQAPVKYELQMPGSLKVDSIKCPNCGAGLDPSKIQLKQGAPTIKCSYCGNEFEVAEEPKW
jgi:DNA-directed RNA polymerase subunit RPC12/RpoP